MDIFHITSAVVWVDFITIALHKIFNLGSSLDKWYDQFGAVAVISDCLVIIIGILIAKIFLPSIPLVFAAILVQLIHDILFYLFVIVPIPSGHNKMIDLFKEYSVENSWKILLADSLMIGSTVLIAQQLSSIRTQYVQLIGLVGAYALTYIIYTR